MVYEHNDEELPEPDLEPGEIWEDSDTDLIRNKIFLVTRTQDLRTSQMRKSEIWIGKQW